MSEHILKFFLAELKTVRIHCQRKNCGGIVELPLSKLSLAPYTCPVCQEELRDRSGSIVDSLGELRRAVDAVLDMKDKVQLEFVLPDKD